jgi:hypothetical protein
LSGSGALAAIDTLAYARRLRDAGIPEPQADAQAVALAEALRQNTGEIVTRGDLKELKLKLEARFFADVRQDIAAMKADLLK